VNLTAHEVVLDSQVPSPPGDEHGSPVPATISLPPDGRYARVDDDRSRLSEGWLNTAPGLIRLTRLRRSGRVVGLPGSRPGTRYLVPRVTAFSMRSRRDLVFPYDEVRDSHGRVAGAHGLAAFRRRQALAERYRDWRVAVRDRRSRRQLNKQWLTGVIFASATALLSGALGLVLDMRQRPSYGEGSPQKRLAPY
jgi:hypothetical protein